MTVRYGGLNLYFTEESAFPCAFSIQDEEVLRVNRETYHFVETPMLDKQSPDEFFANIRKALGREFVVPVLRRLTNDNP